MVINHEQAVADIGKIIKKHDDNMEALSKRIATGETPRENRDGDELLLLRGVEKAIRGVLS